MITRELEFAGLNFATYNPRIELKPGSPKWNAIDASLDEFGQVETLVWNQRTGNVVGGHQRINVMKHRGRDRAWFCVVDLDLASEMKLNIALNKVGGEWDFEKLEAMLREMQHSVSFTGMGFDDRELQALNILAESLPTPTGETPVTPTETPPPAAANKKTRFNRCPSCGHVS